MLFFFGVKFTVLWLLPLIVYRRLRDVEVSWWLSVVGAVASLYGLSFVYLAWLT